MVKIFYGYATELELEINTYLNDFKICPIVSKIIMNENHNGKSTILFYFEK